MIGVHLFLSISKRHHYRNGLVFASKHRVKDKNSIEMGIYLPLGIKHSDIGMVGHLLLNIKQKTVQTFPEGPMNFLSKTNSTNTLYCMLVFLLTGNFYRAQLKDGFLN